MSQEPSPDKRDEGVAALNALAEIADAMDLPLAESVSVERLKGHILKAVTIPSHVVPSKPIGARDGVLCYSPGDQCAGCDHYEGKAPVCSFAPSTTPLSEATPRTDAVMDSITVAAHSEWSALEELARQLERELGESMNRCDEALEAAEAAVRQRDSATSATRRTHDVLLAITHGYVEWEATGDFDKLVKAINEAEVHRQEIAPPQNNSPDGSAQS